MRAPDPTSARIGERGALDADAPITTSFLLGSPELYEWVDGNARLRVLRTETTNDPALIARQRKMTSINTRAPGRPVRTGQRLAPAGPARSCLQRLRGPDRLLVGALHSPDGRAVIALPSVHPKAGASTVVPPLEAPATSFQHSHVVSEQGTARVWGCDQREQARGLIEQVAHPSAREGLQVVAAALGLDL